MKVIGTCGDAYSPRYIVEVSHDELKAAFEKAYADRLAPKHRSNDHLEVGDELDLRTIPNQRARIEAATEAMRKAYVEFVKAAPVMAEVTRVIAGERQMEGGAA